MFSFHKVNYFDLAVVKFGQNKVFEALEKAMETVNEYCKEFNLRLFMIAASYKESPVCAINHLLRRDISWVKNKKHIMCNTVMSDAMSNPNFNLISYCL